MTAAPNRRTVLAARPGPQPKPRPVGPSPGPEPRRKPRAGRESRRVVAVRRRKFLVLVVAPVLLMLGSVYLHTVAAGLDAQAAGLQEQLDAAEAEGERLGIRANQLASPERIRGLAAEELDMRAPAGADLEVYEGANREDGTQDDNQRTREAAR